MPRVFPYRPLLLACSTTLLAGWGLTLGCSSDSTHYGPPGGLTGKFLPMPTDVPDAASPGDVASDASAGSPSEPTDAGTTPPLDASSEAASTVDAAPACSVSWSGQIFPKMSASGAWKCADSSCHGGFQSPKIGTDARAAYASLAAYKTQFAPTTLPYILPDSTDPQASAIECNLSGTACGPQMPVTSSGAQLLKSQDIATIDTWVRCGAPNN